MGEPSRETKANAERRRKRLLSPLSRAHTSPPADFNSSGHLNTRFISCFRIFVGLRSRSGPRTPSSARLDGRHKGNSQRLFGVPFMFVLIPFVAVFLLSAGDCPLLGSSCLPLSGDNDARAEHEQRTEGVERCATRRRVRNEAIAGDRSPHWLRLRPGESSETQSIPIYEEFQCTQFVHHLVFHRGRPIHFD